MQAFRITFNHFERYQTTRKNKVVFSCTEQGAINKIKSLSGTVDIIEIINETIKG